MDHLSELFAHKPTSSIGEGLVASTDSLGNSVSSAEQEVVIVQRFSQADLSLITSYEPLYVKSSGIVVPGTIGGVTPTIGGDAIDDSPPPELTIGSGTKYIVCTINLTLEIDAGVYVEGYSAISSVVLTATSTDPGDGGMLSTDGEFKLKLATFVDGVKTAQFFTGSKSIQVCDDGTGDARGALHLIAM